MGLFIRAIVLLWVVLCVFGGGFYLLFPKLKVWDSDFRQRSEAFQAIFSGNEANLKEYISKGGEVNVRSVLGLTPLHAACATGQIGMASILLRAGAEVGRRNWFGASPLAMASMRGQHRLIEALFKGAADADSTRDPASSSSSSSSTTNSIYHLSANQRGWYGESALHWALSSSSPSSSPSSPSSTSSSSSSNPNRLATLGALVKAGADPLLRNYIGESHERCMKDTLEKCLKMKMKMKMKMKSVKARHERNTIEACCIILCIHLSISIYITYY